MNGGDGTASVKVTAQEKDAVDALARRTQSRPDVSPETGADLGNVPAKGGATKSHSNPQRTH